MADLFDVIFEYAGERANCGFEFRRNAVAFAMMLDHAEMCTSVRVIDEFGTDGGGYPTVIWSGDER